MLFQTASQTLQEFARNPQPLGAEIGITAVLHTWGQTLTEHVHVHCVVTGGGLSPDGTHLEADRDHVPRPEPGRATPQGNRRAADRRARQGPLGRAR